MALLTEIRIAHQGKNQVNYFSHNSIQNLPRLQVVLVLVLGLERAPAGSYYLCSLSILLSTLAAFAISYAGNLPDDQDRPQGLL